MARRPGPRQRRPRNQVFNKHPPEDPYRQSGQHQLTVGAASMNLIQWRKHGLSLESVCKTMPPRASHRQGPICTPTGRRIFCLQGLAQLFLLDSLIRQTQACNQTQYFIILRTSSSSSIWSCHGIHLITMCHAVSKNVEKVFLTLCFFLLPFLYRYISCDES